MSTSAVVFRKLQLENFQLRCDLKRAQDEVRTDPQQLVGKLKQEIQALAQEKTQLENQAAVLSEENKKVRGSIVEVCKKHDDLKEEIEKQKKATHDIRNLLEDERDEFRMLQRENGKLKTNLVEVVAKLEMQENRIKDLLAVPLKHPLNSHSPPQPQPQRSPPIIHAQIEGGDKNNKAKDNTEIMKRLEWCEQQIKNDVDIINGQKNFIAGLEIQIDLLSQALQEHDQLRNSCSMQSGDRPDHTLNEIEFRENVHDTEKASVKRSSAERQSAHEKEKIVLENMVAEKQEDIFSLTSQLRSLEDKNASQKVFIDKQIASIKELQEQVKILGNALEENKVLQKRCEETAQFVSRQETQLREAEEIMKEQHKILTDNEKVRAKMEEMHKIEMGKVEVVLNEEREKTGSLESALRGEKEKNEKLEGFLNELKASRGQMESDLNCLKENDKRWEGALQEMEEKNGKLEGFLKELKQNNTKLETTLKGVIGKNRTLESTLKELKGKNGKSEGSLRELTVMNRSLEGTLRDLTAKNKNLESILREVTAKNGNLEVTLRELTTKNGNLEGTLRQVTAKNENLEGTLKELTTTNENLECSLEELTAKNGQMGSTLRELKEVKLKNRKLEGILKEFKIKNGKLEGALKEVKLKNLKFEYSLKTRNKSLDKDLHEKNEKLESALNELKKKNSTIEKMHKDEVTKLEGEVTELKKNIDKMEATHKYEVYRLEEFVKELVEKIVYLEKTHKEEIARLEGELKEIKEKNEDFTNEREKIDKFINAIKKCSEYTDEKENDQPIASRLDDLEMHIQRKLLLVQKFCAVMTKTMQVRQSSPNTSNVVSNPSSSYSSNTTTHRIPSTSSSPISQPCSVIVNGNMQSRHSQGENITNDKSQTTATATSSNKNLDKSMPEESQRNIAALRKVTRSIAKNRPSTNINNNIVAKAAVAEELNNSNLTTCPSYQSSVEQLS